MGEGIEENAERGVGEGYIFAAFEGVFEVVGGEC